MPLIIVIQQLWNIICLGCPSNGVYVFIYMCIHTCKYTPTYAYVYTYVTHTYVHIGMIFVFTVVHKELQLEEKLVEARAAGLHLTLHHQHILCSIHSIISGNIYFTEREHACQKT